MGSFRKYNGKEGFDSIHHTATGYKCKARIFNPDDIHKEIEFFAKHIVGSNGRPYTEFGFEANESFNYRDLMERVKSSLKEYGFEETFSILNSDEDELTFAEHASPIPNVISIRANAGKDGIIKVFEALSDFISDDCIQFIKDQESDLEENLYLSIYSAMGDELKRGPGGEEMAQQRARDLADMFLNGYAGQA